MTQAINKTPANGSVMAITGKGIARNKYDRFIRSPFAQQTAAARHADRPPPIIITKEARDVTKRPRDIFKKLLTRRRKLV
ncbi:hypothetical protein B5F39_09115 [Cloacibacillus sp. An23]|nr:hypothetical protein B5F39_09115 [Cloacibacillus sp. An23]